MEGTVKLTNKRRVLCPYDPPQPEGRLRHIHTLHTMVIVEQGYLCYGDRARMSCPVVELLEQVVRTYRVRCWNSIVEMYSGTGIFWDLLVRTLASYLVT